MSQEDCQTALEPQSCMAELLSENPVILDADSRAALLAALEEALGPVSVLKSEDAFIHFALNVRTGDETIPAQFAFISDAGPDTAPDPALRAESIAASVRQTWNWPEAEDAVAGAGYGLRIVDLMTDDLPPAMRLELFQKVLRAAVTLVPCAGLHFPLSQCLVSPEDCLANDPDDDDYFPLLGLVNVRYYTVRDTEDEILMDTLGLYVFGLPDAQCHCTGADPDELGGWLFSLAQYILESNEPVCDGDVIDGVDGTRLIMRYDESLADPGRLVIDLAAGE